MQAFQAATDRTDTYFLINGNIIDMLKEIYIYAPRAIVLDIQSQVYKDDFHVSITFFNGPLPGKLENLFNGLIFPLTGNLYTV
jgi:hypothetical protein